MSYDAQMEVSRLEEEAIRKDKQISQLTSRMREYEMGEYGLAEAVAEIKDCKKIMRARDKEIEVLTDEINTLKLQMTDFTEKQKSHQCKPIDIASIFNNELFIDIKEQSVIKKNIKQIQKLNKMNQCQLSMLPTQVLEELYAAQVQNEDLRLELSKICEKAIELSLQLQNQNQQDKVKYEKSMYELRKELLNLNASVNNKLKWDCCAKFSSDCHAEILSDYYQTLLHNIQGENVEVQEIFNDLTRQINVLKSNQLVLVRRYIILTDKESSLQKENIKLRKAMHVDWRRSTNISQSLDLGGSQEITLKCLGKDDLNFLKTLSEQSQMSCKDLCCQKTMTSLISIIKKLQSEVPLLHKLLEISNHQTQAIEAMWYAQEVEMKMLREQFVLFQAQSDEKMLLGKLILKVLQLQFNQASCLYELKKYKSNQQTLQDWYSSLKGEYEQNGKKIASLYLEAQDKIKHLHSVLKDLCLRSNQALNHYIKSEKFL